MGLGRENLTKRGRRRSAAHRTLIEDHQLNTANRTLEHYGFPAFERERQTEQSREITQETVFDEAALQTAVEERTPSLNQDQQAVGCF